MLPSHPCANAVQYVGLNTGVRCAPKNSTPARNDLWWAGHRQVSPIGSVRPVTENAGAAGRFPSGSRQEACTFNGLALRGKSSSNAVGLLPAPTACSRTLLCPVRHGDEAREATSFLPRVLLLLPARRKTNRSRAVLLFAPRGLDPVGKGSLHGRIDPMPMRGRVFERRSVPADTHLTFICIKTVMAAA
jgi:hypothetical protein